MPAWVSTGADDCSLPRLESPIAQQIAVFADGMGSSRLGSSSAFQYRKRACVYEYRVTSRVVGQPEAIHCIRRANFAIASLLKIGYISAAPQGDV